MGNVKKKMQKFFEPKSRKPKSPEPKIDIDKVMKPAPEPRILKSSFRVTHHNNAAEASSSSSPHTNSGILKKKRVRFLMVEDKDVEFDDKKRSLNSPPLPSKSGNWSRKLSGRG
jgi:hypothetical protein